jgi:hypothetical protein
MNKINWLAGAIASVALAGCAVIEPVLAVPGPPVGMPQAALAQPAPTVEATVRGCSVGPRGEADRDCDSGALNPAVTQDTIATTICVPGWTKTVRPPTSYTSPLRDAEMLLYHPPGTPTTAVRQDHLYPLELGGHPTDPANLWPQPVGPSYAKNTHGGRLKDQVCSGARTLASAQAELIEAWSR